MLYISPNGDILKCFIADASKITSRQSDGTVTLSFSTGEYQLKDILETFEYSQKMIQSGKPLKITIEPYEL